MNRIISSSFITCTVLTGLLFAILSASPVLAQSSTEHIVRPIIFPVIGSTSYRNDFGEPRSGHTHEGNDIMGKKMQPLVAVVSGTIRSVIYPEASYGYSLAIEDAEGYQYHYLHINNDHPGTDDGNGGGQFAYAPDMIRGAPVVQGQLIGWMGDSGNAENAGPHLHFEIHTPNGITVSPFFSLSVAQHITTPVIDYPALPGEIRPFGNFAGGVSIAAGIVENQQEGLMIGAGAGGGPRVLVLATDGATIADFMAYPPAFHGGVNVALGDIDGDGKNEIITGAGPGGGPHVRVFTLNGQPLAGWFAYPPGFRGGVHVASADIDGDGKSEIITGAGPGGGPHVRIFSGSGNVRGGFFAYASTFRGGVNVAAGDIDSDGHAEIITGAGPGGGPHVRVFDVFGHEKTSFFADDPQNRSGVSVAVQVGNNQNARILTVPTKNNSPIIKLFTPTGEQLDSATAFEPWWIGGYTLTATSSKIYIGSGYGRRASVRRISFDRHSFF